MKKIFTFLSLCIAINASALDPNHFTITRITAPYFIVDGNSPTTITSAYVGFEVRNNSNSATSYSGLKFTITSIGTTVVGQNYSLLSPVSGITNIGTLAPGESKVCYYYVSYPASVTPQATFNVQLTDITVGTKTQSFVIRNRSSISANAGGTATQTFSNQDIIGGLITDDVTYVVGNVQNGDESDFQVAVSSQFDPTKVTLLGTQVIASSVPGIANGTTDSLYFVTGSGSNGATITVRWTFRITGFNFTTYLLPCAGATSGSTNYKYALNTSLGSGTPITVSSTANPLTISKTSDQTVYGVTTTAVFTITIQNPGAYGVTIDRITDQIPAGFSFQAIDGTSAVTAANSTSIPANGSTGTITFEGGVVSGANTSYYVPAGGSIILKYTATTAASSASNLSTTARGYVATTEIGAAQNIVSVSSTLPVTILSFKAAKNNGYVKLDWTTANEINSELFEIERGNSVGGFNKVGMVWSVGSASSVTSYSFIDPFPFTGTNYYRLKAVDKDQQYKYSAVVAINNKQDGISVQKIFPNPFSANIGIRLVANKKQGVLMQLSDLSGRLILSQTENCLEGVNDISILQLDKLNAGTYFLRFVTAESVQWIKLIKAK